jgi:predicted lipoprotein with Yx(FWY)xxD motif
MRAHLTTGAALVAGVLFLTACGSGDSNSADSGRANEPDTVTTARNAKLGQTVLVDHSGKTLYALTAEKNGRFICTDKACLSLWTPLTVPAGARPRGSVASLSTIKRPDGELQVTYRSRPLYTFAQDARPGDDKGEGFRDVGVWHAVTASGTAGSQPAPAGGGGYGGY